MLILIILINILYISGTEKEATQVMNLAKFDALLHLGDYDYECKPDSYFNNILTSSRSYKFFGILGNHESTSECGESKYYQYINNIYSQMTSSKNKNTSCTFSSGKTMWTCVYKNMRIIGLSPSISKSEKRDAQLAFLKKYLSDSKEDWKICAWHYYDGYYHTGKYPKDDNYVSGKGESFYDYCKDHGALIFSAHDHVYARTHVMSSFSDRKIDSYDSKTSSNIVQIRNGATINILSAVGGYEIYSEGGKYKNFSHWQKKYARGDSSENAKKYGTLNCKFNVGGNNKKATCEFLRINSSSAVFDSFTIYRNENPSKVSYSKIDDEFFAEKVAAYESKNYGKTGGSNNNDDSKDSSNGNRDVESSSIKISTNNRCGSSYGKCPDGKCCSKYGYCNSTIEHCDIDAGCQVKYGVCKTYKIVTKKTSTRKSSTKKTSTKKTTKTSTRKTSTRKTSTKKTSTKKSSGISSSDRCGEGYGKCSGSRCCSKYGWCGTSSKYCESGCQSLFGKCW